MNTRFTQGMAKATELTRSGNLKEATDLIKALLQPAKPDTNPPSDRLDAGGAIIEGDFVPLDPVADQPAPQTEPKTAPPTARAAAPATVGVRPLVAKARSTLAETLRRIAAGGMPVQGVKSGSEAPVPPGGQFLTLTHAAAQGSRSYRLYVPANRPDAPMPLILMLHGCTQTPEDFAAGTGMNELAEEFGCLIAYPGQPSGANMQKCWNWYRPEDQVRGQGEPALLAGLTRDILRDHAADPQRIYVAGLSAGGAAAVLVAAAYPDIFAAAGVHSGLPAGGAHDIPSAFAAMRSGTNSKPHRTILPTIVFHGLADSTVHPANGAAVLSQSTDAMPGLRVAVQTGRSKGGRSFRTTTHHHPDGRSLAEHWEIAGAGHAWAGGNPAGSFTDASGPDASRQMLRFFLQHRKA